MSYLQILNYPLGMGTSAGLVGQPKQWIASAIGVASSLLGGALASNAADEAERRQREQEAQERAWYNRRYNEDYIDTAAGQNLLRRAKDYARETWQKAEGARAVAGGTDAASAQAKEAGNKMVGDTMANVAATDQQRKAQVDAMHRQQEAQFAQMDIARANQRAQAITQAAQGASNAIMSMEGMGESKPSLQGVSNESHTTPLNIPQDRPDAGKVTLTSNVHGIGGEYDANELRRLAGLPT